MTNKWNPFWLGYFGDFFARRGRWAEAEDRFREALRLRGGTEPDDFLRRAGLLVRGGDFEGYRTVCAQAMTFFDANREHLIADRWSCDIIAKTCLIIPVPDVKLGVIADMTDAALRAANGTEKGWFQVTKGLLEYRAGRWANAVEWNQKALAALNQKERSLRVIAFCVMGMAQHRSGEHASGRSSMASALVLLDPEMSPRKSNDPGPGWWDAIFADALLKEATALRDGSEKSGSSR